MQNIKLNQTPIFSFTGKELIDARDGDFIHHDQYASELEEPELEYAYANTLRLSVKSSKYGKKDKKTGGTNITKYSVFILFEDFYTIGRDKDIDFSDAVDYAVDYADWHIRCTCPAAQFWGYNYESTALNYIYGVPKENRFPKIRNPELKGTVCKHADIAIRWVLSHKDIVTKLFATYYGRLNDGQSIYAVNTKGTTITIGKKNDKGDIFFEQQVEEENMSEDQTPEEQVEETVTEETSDDVDNLDPDTWWAEEDDNVTDTDEENE